MINIKPFTFSGYSSRRFSQFMKQKSITRLTDRVVWFKQRRGGQSSIYSRWLEAWAWLHVFSAWAGGQSSGCCNAAWLQLKDTSCQVTLSPNCKGPETYLEAWRQRIAAPLVLASGFALFDLSTKQKKDLRITSKDRFHYDL